MVMGGLLAGLIGLWLAAHFSAKERRDTRAPLTLKQDEAAKVEIKPSLVRKAVRQADGTVKATRQYVPPEGRTTVVVKTDGKVEVIVKNRGWCLAPGIGGAYRGGKAAGVVDAKWFYWGRVGGVAGLIFPKLDAYVGPSFQVYRNTSLFVGYSLRHEIVAGFRLSF